MRGRTGFPAQKRSEAGQKKLTYGTNELQKKCGRANCQRLHLMSTTQSWEGEGQIRGRDKQKDKVQVGRAELRQH